MILIATYDLHQPGRDYPAVEKLLKSASGGFFHLQESVWLLDSLNNPAWWRDHLQEAGDDDDSFFVARLRHNWATRNARVGAGTWLKDAARRW
jgi:CRISPR/Cas system-associated endoribonuclease Cas2